MADQIETAIAKNEQLSVRQFAPGAYGGIVGSGSGLGFLWPARSDLLPRYSTLECDIALRTMHYNQYNALHSGAVEIFAEKYLSIPYEISGGRNLTFQWQDLFAQADFGEGYHTLMHSGIVDYCTLNRGMFIELVSYGDSDTPIKEGAKILGINHLDALRIQFTGNREWPYLYYSEWTGGMHRMHYTRVIRVVRQPSPDTALYGMGKSSLYDSISVANAQVLLGKHQNELLSDLPPPGIVIFNNVRPDEVQDAMKQFEYERVRDGQNVYRAPVSLSSLNPEQPATVTFIPFSTVPEGFEYEKFMMMHVNMTALAFGLDPQDLWPLTGKAIGSAEQSKVLQAKTDVKGPAHLADILTPLWNFRVLPRQLQWKYKAPNGEADKQTADITSTWVTTLKNADFLNIKEKRGIAAAQIPAFADELMDESGEVRLFEDDPKEPDQVIVASDDIELTTATDAPQITAGQDTQQPNTDQSALAISQPKAMSPAMPKQVPQKQPAPVTNKPVDPAVNNKFKDTQDQLKAGLLTMAQAQTAIGITPDPIYEGMYLVEGFPVPREKLRDLWQAHFGRGVASFDAVVSGETLPSGNGSGAVPSYASKELPVIRKAIDATDSAFVSEIEAIMSDGVNKSITKAGCAARMRGAINRYGKAAYQDGMQEGGVDPSDMDDEDKLTIADIAVHDTQFVTDLVNEIYSEDGMKGTPESRSPMWLKTLSEFYYAGIAASDKNGVYKWVLGDTEHCASCLKMSGQIHRMKDYIRTGITPQCNLLDCGGYHCGCSLEKTSGKSQGSWL